MCAYVAYDVSCACGGVYEVVSCVCGCVYEVVSCVCGSVRISVRVPALCAYKDPLDCDSRLTDCHDCHVIFLCVCGYLSYMYGT